VTPYHVPLLLRTLIESFEHTNCMGVTVIRLVGCKLEWTLQMEKKLFK